MSGGRQYIRDIEARQEVARPTALGLEEQTLLPSLTEYSNYIRSSKRIEIYGPTPELRFIESDQADPVGQFRFQGSSGSLTLSKALTASWATEEVILQHDVTNKVTYLNAITAADWYVRIQGGNILTTGGFLDVGATTGIYTGNGAGGSVLRMRFVGNAATPDIDIPNAAANLDLNGNVLKGIIAVRGRGTGNVNLQAYSATTDATAYRMVMYVLNPATDTEYAVAQAVPDAAVPKFTFAAPDDAPSTSELDDGHITFGYTKATDTLTVYVNEGGAIKSLVLGVMV